MPLKKLQCLPDASQVRQGDQGQETDKKISELFKCDLVRSSFIPPLDIWQLRDLCRYYAKLTGFASREKNRAQNCLTMCSFKLDDVFTDVFGKSAPCT